MALPQPIPNLLVELIAQRLRVLGQPLRIRILDDLDRGGETTVQALADRLDSGQQNMSRHLGVLHQTGLIARRREGRQVWYSLATPDALSLLEMAGAQAARQLQGVDSS